jgi:hypothetical protein
MKLAQDYKNIASLYSGQKRNQQNFEKIESYLHIFSEDKPLLFLKQVQGNTHIYEWRNPTIFFNGFTPCLIIECFVEKFQGRNINLQNKNILKTNIYSNFTLTENNILYKKSEVQLLRSI